MKFYRAYILHIVALIVWGFYTELNVWFFVGMFVCSLSLIHLCVVNEQAIIDILEKPKRKIKSSGRQYQEFFGHFGLDDIVYVSGDDKSNGELIFSDTDIYRNGGNSYQS